MTPFCYDMGFPFNAIVRGELTALESLAEIAGIAASDLSRNAFISTRRGHGILRSEEVRSPWVGRKPSRVCPVCLSEDVRLNTGPAAAARYYRYFWIFSFIRSCPVHNAPLVALPAVGSYRNYDLHYRASIFQRELNSAMSSAGSAPFTSFEQFVLDRLEGKKAHGDLLDGMSLIPAADICELVGVYTTYGKFANIAKLSERELQIGADAGYRLLIDGFSGLRDFGLRMIWELDQSRYVGRGRQILGGIYEKLLDRDHLDYDAIRNELSLLIDNNVRLTTDLEIFGRKMTADHVSTVAAYQAVGGSVKMAQGILRLFSTGDPANTSVFKSSAVADAASYLSNLVLASEARSYLGVNIQIFRQLQKRALVHPDAEFSKLFPKASPRYSKIALQDLIDRACATSPVGKRQGLVPLSKVAQKTAVEIGDLVGLIIDQKLKTVSYDPEKRGLDRIQIDPSEVRSLTLAGPSWMSTGDVAEKMKTSVYVVRLTARQGLLTGHRLKLTGYKPHVLYFSSEEVSRFTEKFALAVELAELTGLKVPAIAQLLRNETLPKARADYLVFYDRARALELLAPDVRAAQTSM